MSARIVYVGGTKEALTDVLEAALIQLKASPEGSVSVWIQARHARPGVESVVFTDEDTANDRPGQIVIEVES